MVHERNNAILPGPMTFVIAFQRDLLVVYASAVFFCVEKTRDKLKAQDFIFISVRQPCVDTTTTPCNLLPLSNLVTSLKTKGRDQLGGLGGSIQVP